MADILKPTADISVFSPDGVRGGEVNTDLEQLVHDQHAIDQLTIVAAGVENDLVSKGKAWSYTPASVLAVAKLATIDVLIVTGSTHLIIRDISVNVNRTSASGFVEATFHENVVTSANGTQVYPWNNKRDSTEVFAHAIYTQPTVTNFGDKRVDYLVHTDWETYISPSYTTPYQIILKPNTKYLFRVLNNLQQVIDATYYLFFYETP